MKEKLDKKVVMVVQRSLYNNFKKECEDNYKTMSEVLRDFMLRYLKECKNVKEKDNN
jgi:predicted alpha/beta-fold hydrolase